jgi:hypothetical protein
VEHDGGPCPFGGVDLGERPVLHEGAVPPVPLS